MVLGLKGLFRIQKGKLNYVITVGSGPEYFFSIKKPFFIGTFFLKSNFMIIPSSCVKFEFDFLTKKSALRMFLIGHRPIESKG
jgi:hypothetical protein